MRAVAMRFGIGSLVALAVLLGTGAALASHLERWSEDVLQAKLSLLVLIGVLTALHVVRRTRVRFDSCRSVGRCACPFSHGSSTTSVGEDAGAGS